MARHGLRLAIVGAATLAACGGDDPTGPAVRNVAGTWTYAFSQLSNGSGVVCSGTATMPITQAGATFSGTYAGSLTCRFTGGADTSDVFGTVVAGRVVDDSVYFNMDNGDWRNLGVLDDAGMRGTLNASFLVNGVPTVAAGNFTCVKQ